MGWVRGFCCFIGPGDTLLSPSCIPMSTSLRIIFLQCTVDISHHILTTEFATGFNVIHAQLSAWSWSNSESRYVSHSCEMLSDYKSLACCQFCEAFASVENAGCIVWLTFSTFQILCSWKVFLIWLQWWTVVMPSSSWKQPHNSESYCQLVRNNLPPSTI